MKVEILLSSSPTSSMLRFKGFNFQSKQVFGIEIVAIVEFQLNFIIILSSHTLLILNHPFMTKNQIYEQFVMEVEGYVSFSQTNWLPICVLFGLFLFGLHANEIELGVFSLVFFIVLKEDQKKFKRCSQIT